MQKRFAMIYTENVIYYFTHMAYEPLLH